MVIASKSVTLKLNIKQNSLLMPMAQDKIQQIKYLTFFILDFTQNMISTGVPKPQPCERKPTYQQTPQMHMWKTYYTSSLFLSTAACREGEDTKG